MKYLFVAAILCIIFLAYRRARLWVFTATLLTLGAIALRRWGFDEVVVFGYCVPLLVVAALLNIRPLRRRLFSRPILRAFRQLLPPISATEREALEAGSVWWDAELFSGKPDWGRLLSVPRPSLRPDERAFLDGPVETLCRMLDDWQIGQDGDLPESVWQFLRQNRMLGLIIPRAYGGLEFSAQGNSAVVQKIASRSQTAAVTVMVPNSLGPGELLVHYGTAEQKNHYLPRLARGEEIPCFALTGPYAGSDAAALPDVGVACVECIDGEEVIGFRVDFDKRYITLAPVATLIGLAFRAVDPDGVLGDRPELGITCALVPAETSGIESGDRHIPTGAPFMNGPIRGRGVFIRLDQVIGGRERVGQGWRMLMACLSAGRAISLPALGTAGAKQALATSGAYARIRRQFKTPIAQFEGVEEVLADMAGRVYRMEASRSLTLGALDQGEKPAVISAILKYHLTEDYRRCVNAAMDIHAGKTVVEGPSNHLAAVYQSIPMAITVEGANILTRSLIIFGQGAIRCHPFLLREMRAVQDADDEAGLREFDIALFGHIGYSISNGVRAIWLALTGGRFTRAPVTGPLADDARRLKRFAAAFAVTADSLLLLSGPRFKRMERMSGRLADVLSHLYMASAVVKRFRDDGCPEEDREIAELALALSFGEVERQLQAVLRNFPVPWLGRVLRVLFFPWGAHRSIPDDRLVAKVAARVSRNGPSRQRLIGGIDLDPASSDPAGRLEDAFGKVLAAERATRAIRNALGEEITPLNVDALVERCLGSGIITEQQAEAVRAAQEAVAAVIQVDHFPHTSRIGRLKGIEKAG